MKKLIVILAIVACASIAQAQTYDANGNYIGYSSRHQTTEERPAYWPTRNYNETPPPGIQWNIERPAYQNDWYDISTGHYTTPPPGVLQTRPRTFYEMPR